MHGLGDRLVRLQPKLADKNFILVQNCVSEDKGEKVRGLYHSGERGYPANRVTAEGLQHHTNNFDIAELFVQRLNLLNVRGSDGNRNRVVVALAAWFY
jgi:hypothetical protein